MSSRYIPSVIHPFSTRDPSGTIGQSAESGIRSEASYSPCFTLKPFTIHDFARMRATGLIIAIPP